MKNKKHRQYRSRQGRSDEQYSTSVKVIAVAFGGLIITILILI
jgi:hypothetical protein